MELNSENICDRTYGGYWWVDKEGVMHEKGILILRRLLTLRQESWQNFIYWMETSEETCYSP